MPLTVIRVKNAKPGSKRLTLTDGHGLRLIVHPKGTKTWKFSYRLAGRQREVTGGTFPEVSLEEARQWRSQCRAMVAKGEDPAHEKRIARSIEKGETFKEIALEWFEKQRPKWKPVTQGRKMGRLEYDAFPVLGDMPIAQITHRDIHRLIARIEERGAFEMARKVVGMVSAIFRYAKATQRVEADPVPDVRDSMKVPPKVKHRAKLPIKQIGEFFVRLEEYQADPVTKLALRWTILTMARTGETRFMRLAEIEGLGTKEPIWRVPADRMKMEREHLVPLPKQALPLLDQIKDLAAKEGSPWLFPQSRNPKKPISENCMLYRLYDLGYKGVATVHGFRGVASTLLNEQVNPDGSKRFDKDWIEMQLAHSEEDDSRAAYNAAEYIGPRRNMLQWWADYLEDQEAIASLL